MNKKKNLMETLYSDEWHSKTIEKHLSKIKISAYYFFPRNKEDYEDLYQETMLKIWKNRSRYAQSSKASYMSWVQSIMRNIFFDTLRKNKYIKNGLADYWHIAERSTESSAISTIIMKECEEVLKTAKGDAEFVLYMRIEGYSFDEINYFLGKPPRNSTSRIKMTKLRKEIGSKLMHIIYGEQIHIPKRKRILNE